MVNAEHGGTPPSSPSPDSFASLFAGLSSVDNTWEAAPVDADASLWKLGMFELPKDRPRGHAVKNNSRQYVTAQFLKDLSPDDRAKALRNAKHIPEFGVHS